MKIIKFSSYNKQHWRKVLDQTSNLVFTLLRQTDEDEKRKMIDYVIEQLNGTIK